MDLMIGGAYQGKLEYAKKRFGLAEQDICVCTAESEPDFSKRCLVHYEEYIRHCLREGKSINPALREDAVIVVEDIFCGVVSMDEEIRAWREECGHALTALALRADTVTRIFCGLPLELKAKEKQG